MHRHGGWLLLLALVACGGEGGSDVARLELSAHSILLTPTHGAQLEARAFAADGAPVEAPVRWRSSNPDVVSVDDEGRLTMAAQVGSAQITAELDSVVSSPALVLATRPAADAVLVDDAQVVGPPQPVDADSYEVRLRGIAPPPAGAPLLARESARLAGRVISAEEVDGEVRVRVRIVPLSDLFDAISVDETLPVVSPPEQQANAGKLQQGLLGIPEGACKGSGTLISLSAGELKSTNTLVFHFAYVKTGDTVERFKAVMEGEARLDFFLGVKGQAGFKGEFVCEWIAYRFPVPIGGAVGFFVGPEVALGLQLKAEGALIAATLQGGLDVKVGFKSKMGPTYTPADGLQWEKGFDPIWEATPKAEVSGPQNFRVDLGFSAGVLAALEVDTALTDPFRLIEATVGPKQSLSLATVRTQANDRAYASAYDLKAAATVGLSGTVKALLKNLGLNVPVGGVSWSLGVPLGKSPAGKLEADRTQAKPGDTVHLSVDLEPGSLTYPFVGENVDKVLVYVFQDGQEPTLVTTIEASASLQQHFEGTWVVPAHASGDYHLVAFTVDRLLSTFASLPLEVAADSRRTVTVGGVCAPFPTGPEFPGTSSPDPSDPAAPQNPPAPDSEPEGDWCDWQGTVRHEQDSLFGLGVKEISVARVRWEPDPDVPPEGTQVEYRVHSGTLAWMLRGEADGCTYEGGPAYFPISPEDGTLSTSLVDGAYVYYGVGITGGEAIVTITCGEDVQQIPWNVSTGGWLITPMPVSVPATEVPRLLEGTHTDPQFNSHWAWRFTRP